jgi:hypothetical protein
VAEKYRCSMGEISMRDPSSMKRFFIHKMCNNNRKPTGSSGIDDFTQRCQTLYRNIIKDEEAENLGDDDDDLFGPRVVSSSSNNDASEVIEDSQRSEMVDEEHDNETPRDNDGDDEVSEYVEEKQQRKQAAAASSTPSTAVVSSSISTKSSVNKSKNNKHQADGRVNAGKSVISLAETAEKATRQQESYMKVESLRIAERERARLEDRQDQIRREERMMQMMQNQTNALIQSQTTMVIAILSGRLPTVPAVQQPVATPNQQALAVPKDLSPEESALEF